jgi:hypothetical protein
LFKLVGKAIKATEYAEGDDESGNRKVEINEDEIIVNEDDGLGSTITEVFRPGPANDSIQSILYSYKGTGDYDVAFNHSFIIAERGNQKSFGADFFGELKGIHKIGKDYLFTADYDLSSSRLGNVHYTNIERWSSKKKSIISRHRFANSAVEPTGYPIFTPWDDGSFISSSVASFSQVDNVVNMEIFETYDRINELRKVDKEAFYVTRYFTFNDSASNFEETRQEVIYEAK